MERYSYLIVVLLNSAIVLGQSTTCENYKCDTNNKVIDVINENLLHFSSEMTNASESVKKEVSKLSDIKLDMDTRNQIQEKLDKVEESIDNLQRTVGRAGRCNNANSSSDEKSCDHGWVKIRNRCLIAPYRVNIYPSNGHEWCQTEYGARLAIIDTQELLNELQDNVVLGDNCIWVSAFRLSDDKWYWVDCTPDGFGRTTCSKWEVNGTMWRNDRSQYRKNPYYTRFIPPYSQTDLPFSATATLPGLSIPREYYYSPNSVFACISRFGLINRDNELRAVFCEYLL